MKYNIDLPISLSYKMKNNNVSFGLFYILYLSKLNNNKYIDC